MSEFIIFETTNEGYTCVRRADVRRVVATFKNMLSNELEPEVAAVYVESRCLPYMVPMSVKDFVTKHRIVDEA